MTRRHLDHAVLYVDGAARGNPGPAGAGFVIVHDGAVLHRAAIPLGRTTNNVAEYRALIAGLHEAAARRIRRLTVRSDSELLIRQMRGEYKVRSQRLQPLYEWAQKVASRFGRVEFEHVPREENREADALAREGARRSQRRDEEGSTG